MKRVIKKREDVGTVDVNDVMDSKIYIYKSSNFLYKATCINDEYMFASLERSNGGATGGHSTLKELVRRSIDSETSKTKVIEFDTGKEMAQWILDNN